MNTIKIGTLFFVEDGNGSDKLLKAATDIDSEELDQANAAYAETLGGKNWSYGNSLDYSDFLIERGLAVQVDAEIIDVPNADYQAGEL